MEEINLVPTTVNVLSTIQRQGNTLKPFFWCVNHFLLLPPAKPYTYPYFQVKTTPITDVSELLEPAT